MVIRGLILGMFLCLPFLGRAQDGISELIETYLAMIDKYDVSNFETFHYKYSIRQEYEDGTKKIHNFELFSNDNKHYLFSKEYLVCADSLLTISIDHATKKIYLGASQTNEIRNQGIQRVVGLQPKILKQLIERKYETTIINGKETTRLTTVCPADFQKAYHVKKAIYEFSAERKEITKIEIFSTDVTPLVKTTIKVILMEVNKSHIELKKNPADFIVDSNNQLLKKFKNYTLEYIGDKKSVPLQITKTN